MAAQPPPLPAGTHPGHQPTWAPVWAIAGLAGLTLVARLALQWQLPFPQCWLRKLTGIPCPACGCTRSLAAWSSGNLEQALFFNPLFFAACLGLLLWLAIWTVEVTSGRTVMALIRAKARRLPWWKLAIALIATNWLYLYLKLPK